jgi:acetyl esterase/lipase
MTAGETALTMDVLRPAKSNRAAVVFLVSGGWMSDHSMLERFEPDLEKVFVADGFTVFAVVHGAQPGFKVAEIVEQVRAAARFVRTHAADYGVDPDRLGVSGISSGGHLALMIAGSPDSPVKAVAAIAPPTDLANWGKRAFVFPDDPHLAMFLPALGLDPKAPHGDVEALAKRLSPIALVRAQYPAALIVHGDSDQIVPVQQAQAMDRALGAAGVDHKLELVPGGGHDDTTFGPGLSRALAWFKATLLR